MTDFIAIIPARYASTRFPGKPLAKIGSKPMIQLVYEQAKKAISEVYVATDDERIFNAVQGFGGRVVMTSPEHRSGTERCFEAYQKIGSRAAVVINIQGDEPFIQPAQIETLKECFFLRETQIATLVKPYVTEESFEDLADQNTPKVVINSRMEAMYFSRSIIPYLRGVDRRQWIDRHSYYKHIGLYAYRADILKEIVSLEPSPLELAENLEQLRWLENGYRIKVGITKHHSIGIDTPDDLERARKMI
ncbi:MAG: 3-deoxy-manno-octulosonate cytidylyltransferase [Prevotellaceae bacterium]|jgi:3-deoxy-manno-octulosonate cytidylyltransferase (CMP-KDO synthetase)|nr:3-deoxy-manno-octulosonate cytidylyltransferase [Prevotellaceae bacterium]